MSPASGGAARGRGSPLRVFALHLTKPASSEAAVLSRLLRHLDDGIEVMLVVNELGSAEDSYFSDPAPTRRVIVERLSQGSASVTELAKPLDMSLPAVLQHLQVLETSGLVRSEKAGRVRTCSIDDALLRKAEQWIARRRATWERRLDRLGEYLAQDEKEEKS